MSETLAQRIDARWDAEIDFLRALVQVPSDNPPGDCAPHAERAAALLDALGLAVERHPVPEEVCRRHGMLSATNLLVRRHFGDGPVVALNAHGDVVPPGEGWTMDPYGAEVRDGWLYGRGAAVSKSDFATYVFALLALGDRAERLRGTVQLHFTYDEETGGFTGPKWLLDQGLTRPDYAICPGFSYEVVTSHKGCLHLQVDVHGLSAHAAEPWHGHDALQGAVAVLKALYAHRRSLAARASDSPGIGAPTLVVGLIKGGINTTVVPDLVRLSIDRRLTPDEDAAAVEAELTDIVASALAGEDGLSADCRRIMLAAPMRPAPGTERLAEVFCEHASAVMGEAVGTGGVPLFTDARHYAAAGIPTILYGAGPRSLIEANGHRANECVPLDDLRKATEVVARSVAEILGR